MSILNLGFLTSNKTTEMQNKENYNQGDSENKVSSFKLHKINEENSILKELNY